MLLSKKFFLILIGIFILVAGSLLAGLMIRWPSSPLEKLPPPLEEPTQSPDKLPPPSSELKPEPEPEKEIKPEEKLPPPLPLDPYLQEKTGILNLASSFAERFGSYSNKSNFENLESLKIFMTPKMRAWAEEYIEDLKVASQGKNIPYWGITTKVLSSEMTSFNPETSSLVKVSTQRQETSGGPPNSKVYYQGLEIKFLKRGGIWQVEGVWWK